MIIICPYAFALREPARLALAEHAPDAELVFTGADDEGYWRVIEKFWTGADDLVVVEQRIEIHEAVIREFTSCRIPWCVFPYEISRGAWMYQGLGCARFTAELQREIPAADLETALPLPLHWSRMEGQVIAAARAHGHHPHVHQPPVTHHRNSLCSCKCD